MLNLPGKGAPAWIASERSDARLLNTAGLKSSVGGPKYSNWDALRAATLCAVIPAASHDEANKADSANFELLLMINLIKLTSSEMFCCVKFNKLLK